MPPPPHTKPENVLKVCPSPLDCMLFINTAVSTSAMMNLYGFRELTRWLIYSERKSSSQSASRRPHCLFSMNMLHPNGHVTARLHLSSLS